MADTPTTPAAEPAIQKFGQVLLRTEFSGVSAASEQVGEETEYEYVLRQVERCPEYIELQEMLHWIEAEDERIPVALVRHASSSIWNYRETVQRPLLLRAERDLARYNVSWSPLVDILVEKKLWPAPVDLRGESQMKGMRSVDDLLGPIAEGAGSADPSELAQALRSFEARYFHRTVAENALILEEEQVRHLAMDPPAWEKAARNKALTRSGADALYRLHAEGLRDRKHHWYYNEEYPLQRMLGERGFETPVDALEMLLDAAYGSYRHRESPQWLCAEYVLKEPATSEEQLRSLHRHYAGRGIEGGRGLVYLLTHPSATPALWKEVLDGVRFTADLVKNLLKEEEISPSLLGALIPYVREQRETICDIIRSKFADLEVLRQIAREIGAYSVRVELLGRVEAAADPEIQNILMQSKSFPLLERLLEAPGLSAEAFRKVLVRLISISPDRGLQLLEQSRLPLGFTLTPAEVVPLLRASKSSTRENALRLLARLRSEETLIIAEEPPKERNSKRSGRSAR